MNATPRLQAIPTTTSLRNFPFWENVAISEAMVRILTNHNLTRPYKVFIFSLNSRSWKRIFLNTKGSSIGGSMKKYSFFRATTIILTFSEARDWWLNGNGQSLYVDLNKLDLSGIKASDFDKGIGSVKTFNLLGKYRSNTVDGLVYGNIELKLIDENTVQVYRRQSYGLPIDVYNFDIKSWSTGTFFRNMETFGGWIVNGGSGTPYIIWMHGQAKIGQ